MPRKAGNFYSLPYSYQYCGDCSTNPDGTPKVTYIPVKKWAKDNNYTIRQCYSLLRDNHLVGLRYKSRMYVAQNGSLPINC